MKAVMVTPAPSVTFPCLSPEWALSQRPPILQMRRYLLKLLRSLCAPVPVGSGDPALTGTGAPEVIAGPPARLILALRCQGRDEQPTLEMRALEVTKPISTPFWWLPVLSPRTEASASPDHAPSFFVSTATRPLNYFCVDSKHRGEQWRA